MSLLHTDRSPTGKCLSVCHQYEGRYVPQLREQCEKLHEVKCRLNKFDLASWSKHTDAQFRGGRVKLKIKQTLDVHPELLTNAWLKLYEILSSYTEIWEVLRQQPDIKTRKLATGVHLGECPGAFVACTNHWLRTSISRSVSWTWWANSLDPWSEMNDWREKLDSSFMRHTYGHWLKGADGTGNLCRLANVAAVLEAEAKVDMVTADGSFGTQHDAASQEELLLPLVLAEVVVAWGRLKPGGVLILKLYGPTTPVTVSVVALLKNSFDKLWLHKPNLSKPGNSEVYAVAVGYVGVSGTLFERSKKLVIYEPTSSANPEVPGSRPGPGGQVGRSLLRLEREVAPACLASILAATRQLVEAQVKCIQDNLNTYSHKMVTMTVRLKDQFALEFMQKFQLQELPRELRVCPNVDLEELSRNAKLSVSATDAERAHDFGDWQAVQQLRLKPFVARGGPCLEVRVSSSATLATIREPPPWPVRDAGGVTPGVELHEFSSQKERTKEVGTGRHRKTLEEPPLAEEMVLALAPEPDSDQTACATEIGRWPQLGGILKPFRIVSSPYYSPDIFTALIRYRVLLPNKVPALAFADICHLKRKEFGLLSSATSNLAGSNMGGSNPAGANVAGQNPVSLLSSVSYDVAIMCLIKFRQKGSAQPHWLEVTHPSELGTMSEPFRRTGCRGLCVDLSSASSNPAGVGSNPAGAGSNPAGAGSNPAGAGSVPVFRCPGGEDWAALKTELRSASLRPAVALVGTHGSVAKREILQEEVDEQKFLLRALRVALRYLADGGDLLLGLSTTGTRFSGSLLLLLSVCFKDLTVARPPTFS
ncbi:ribosomal RNA large subunit methyltransferase J [Gregarina niphandrodes]|uniref:Cap-specific mRNA (nucleoside-2'-O-)-methyltransferase 2 n=1 Tax=Gregarina niphandrodes TaxID=110365 RepID=A0A023AYF2_GRENI|nr:ribosomal RNA large subunit methyltransferase J [Gregarina niphandrodes]EZG43702.1 ribosomal RNA large subunit methyltransferase J [Gregarina niphandrodes]|eukprot:XP_011133066.1 ribosomal RNA large subunit methyltransferase J [Gregarina niphandrodes]